MLTFGCYRFRVAPTKVGLQTGNRENYRLNFGEWIR